MDIMDADEGWVSSSADFLGRCVVKIADIKNELSDGDDIPIPDASQWPVRDRFQRRQKRLGG